MNKYDNMDEVESYGWNWYVVMKLDNVMKFIT
jgi:hypothetical protein